MAVRPVFLAVKAKDTNRSLVDIKDIEFQWHPGFATTQKQKSIRELHTAIKDKPGLSQTRILEISSKSEDVLGVQLSAFNLMLDYQSKKISVESAFQASKAFKNGGPYYDLLDKTSIEAKKDPRLKSSGNVTKFIFDGTEWPIEPKTLFYDWLYIKALTQNPAYSQKMMEFDAFTDIEFNPEKSFNCQARSAAIYVSLRIQGLLDEVISDPETYISFFSNKKEKAQLYIQQNLL